MTLFAFDWIRGQTGSDVRLPAVSGAWYPSEPVELEKMLDGFLNKVELKDIQGKLIGFVAPHAGFVYSGAVAAYDYKLIKDKSYDVVFLIGNAHRYSFTGAAIDSAKFYQTPLGETPVNEEIVANLASSEHDVIIDSRAHSAEHSLEAQLPFLQRVLKPGFSLTPILFGFQPARSYSYLLDKISEIARHKSVLLVASTDLTHFPSYEDSCRIDQKTVEAMATLDVSMLDKVEKQYMEMDIKGVDCVLCGATATKLVMEACKNLGADRGVVLRRANSGDALTRDRRRVVGYGAVAFFDTSASAVKANTDIQDHIGDSLSLDEQKKLLGLARYVLEAFVKDGKTPHPAIPHAKFTEKRGAFVTLHMNNQLRGCIGHIIPEDPLWEVIIENTINSCSRDPRFRPVAVSELSQINMEISVLTPPKKVSSYDDIEIGRHGVILKKNFRQAVFLPQVAPEQGWDLQTTLSHLAMKAGLSENAWRDGAEFEVFEAQVFGEKTLGKQSYSN